jgi:hypothetical protein
VQAGDWCSGGGCGGGGYFCCVFTNFAYLIA